MIFTSSLTEVKMSSCEHDNTSSNSIQGRKCIYHLGVIYSQGGLCFIELVNGTVSCTEIICSAFTVQNRHTFLEIT
jgi:hypothetical protein